MNSSPSAYSGPESYVFVCYAHDDSERVHTDVAWLQHQGVRVWYDEGITAGSHWRAQVGERLQRASSVIFYISAESLASEHCNREINLALDDQIEIVPVYLQDVELTPDLRIGLNRLQALFPQRDEMYRERLLQSLGDIKVDAKQTVQASRMRLAVMAPVLVGALMVTAIVAWWFHSEEDGQPLAIENCEPVRIAVMPMVNVSGDEQQQYLADGVTVEIGNELRDLSGLLPLSMSATRRFRDQETDPRIIGRDLDVRYLIEGELNVAGDLIRLYVRLVDTSNGQEVWGNDYQRVMSDVRQVFLLYDDIAEQVGRELEVFSGRRQPTRFDARTGSMAAYQLVQQSLFVLGQTGNPADGLPLVEQAIEEDPGYAFAHVVKGIWHYQRGEASWGNARESYEAARAAAEKALALNPDEAGAHGLLGGVAMRVDLDFQLALESFSEAARIEPKNPLIYSGYYQDMLYNAGFFEEGLEFIELLESLDPGDASLKTFRSRFLMRLDRLDAARQTLEEAYRLAPRNRMVVTDLLLLYINVLSDRPRAHEIIDAARIDFPDIAGYFSALIALKEGDSAPLHEIAERMDSSSETAYVDPANMSGLYYRLDDYENHMRWFKIRVEERDALSWMLNFRRDNPDYEDRLKTWASESAPLVMERQRKVDEHLALVESVTEKMVFDSTELIPSARNSPDTRRCAGSPVGNRPVSG